MNRPPAVEIFDLELLSAAVRIARSPVGMTAPRWDCVARVFGIGSTQAIALCGRFGYNPNEMITPSQELQ